MMFGAVKYQVPMTQNPEPHFELRRVKATKLPACQVAARSSHDHLPNMPQQAPFRNPQAMCPPMGPCMPGTPPAPARLAALS